MRSDMFWLWSSFVTLFYLVSPRRCNHGVVQRNNQQGPRLRLPDRMVAAFDMTWYLMPFGSFAVFGAFFQRMLTDWLCLIVWKDAVDVVDWCQVTKAIERQLEQSLGLSAVWLVRIYSHLYTFVIIEKTGCIPKLRPLDNYCWHLMLPYHCSIFGYIQNCFWQRPSHHQAVPCRSQWNLRLVFQFCLCC